MILTRFHLTDVVDSGSTIMQIFSFLLLVIGCYAQASVSRYLVKFKTSLGSNKLRLQLWSWLTVHQLLFVFWSFYVLSSRAFCFSLFSFLLLFSFFFVFALSFLIVFPFLFLLFFLSFLLFFLVFLVFAFSFLIVFPFFVFVVLLFFFLILFVFYCHILLLFRLFAKLSPSSSLSWAELVIISAFPATRPTTRPTTRPPGKV